MRQILSPWVQAEILRRARRVRRYAEPPAGSQVSTVPVVPAELVNQLAPLGIVVESHVPGTDAVVAKLEELLALLEAEQARQDAALPEGLMPLAERPRVAPRRFSERKQAIFRQVRAAAMREQNQKAAARQRAATGLEHLASRG